MKRYIFIISILIANLSIAQMQTPDRLWDSIVVSGSDTLLWDRIIGAADPDAKLIGYEYSLDSNYINKKSKAKIEFFGTDTVAVACLFQNLNLADTLFCKLEDHVLNDDGTELYPIRIIEIAFYDSRTEDINDYFKVPFDSTGSQLWVPNEYATIQEAINAASAYDTIITLDGYYENFTLDNTNYIIAVGASKIDASTSIKVNATNINPTIEGFEITGTEGTNLIEYNTGTIKTSTFTLKRSHLSNNYSIKFSNTNSQEIYLQSSYIKGLIYFWHVPYTLITDCRISGDPNNVVENIRIYDTKAEINNTYLDYSYNFDYSVRLWYPSSLTMSSCWFQNDGIYANSADLSDSTLYIENTTFNNTEGVTRSFVYFVNNVADLELENCTFNEGAIIYYINNKSLKLNNCTFNNQRGNHTFNNSSIGYPLNLTIDSCNFTDTSTSRLNIYNCKGEITNNHFYSNNNWSFLITNTIDLDTVDFTIKNNLFEINTTLPVVYLNKTADYGYNLFLVEENEFRGPGYWGDIPAGFHMTLIWQTNVIFRYNRVWGAYHSCVIKNNGEATIGEAYGNTFINCKVPIDFRTSPNGKAYNNIIYNPTIDLKYGIYIDDNDGLLASDSCQIFNNIFYGNGDDTAIYVDDVSVDGLRCNNNLYWGISRFQTYNTIITYEAWKALGYDANSYMSNPNFYDEANYKIWPVKPSNAIGTGKKLNYPYNIGLNTNTIFPYQVKKTYQKILPSMGSYVVNLGIGIAIDKNFISNNNKLIIQ